jgi:hypothetical protein
MTIWQLKRVGKRKLTNGCLQTVHTIDLAASFTLA